MSASVSSSMLREGAVRSTNGRTGEPCKEHTVHTHYDHNLLPLPNHQVRSTKYLTYMHGRYLPTRQPLSGPASYLT